MTDYLLNSVPDSIVLRDLPTYDQRQKSSDALLIAHIAAVDERRLYLGLGYPSMLEYCMAVLNHTEDSALKRIRVGRAARRIPALFPALADGRLHLSAALLLAPPLTHENADELIAAAARQSKLAIERMLASRFPRPDLPTTITPELPCNEVAPGPPVPCESPAPAASVGPLAPQARVTPLAPGRVGWQTTVDDETQALLDEFKALLSHTAPSAGMAELLKRALTIAVAHQKKAKFAVGARGRSTAAATESGGISDALLREVYERDGGCCSFEGDGGHRCGSTHRLEIDHIIPVALGGSSTLDNLRLLCRAHNQFEAERVLGREHMSTQRELAQRERARVKAAKQAEKERAAEIAKAQKARYNELLPGLRGLGFRREEIAAAAAHCESIASAALEERMTLALRFLGLNVGRRESYRPTEMSEAAGAPAP